MKKDTIAAVSTALLPAGIAVLRLSGPDSIRISDIVFKGKKPLSEASSHTVHYGKIYDGEEVVDEVMATVMKSPNSYTGEDVVEISCHGSVIIPKLILNLIIKHGARHAGPGEFTMRAFLNGRMDLSQAESVMDLISAENDFSIKNSLNHLSGDFSALIDEHRQKILYKIAYIESALDDPEHMSLEGFSDELSELVSVIIDDLDRLIKSFEISNDIKEGVDCAIVGKVNVGKSSLLNALSNSDRAIVTDIPGTTRDIIEQKIGLGNISLNMIDTAGIRESDDKVESIGIEKSKRYIESSSLILLIIDASGKLDDEDYNLINQVKNKKAIIVLNKIDLEQNIFKEDLINISNSHVVEVSAKKMIGFDLLKEEIENLFLSNEFVFENQIFVSNDRHKTLLEDAKKSLENVIEASNSGMSEEIFSVDLTDAYDSLGKILGKSVGEDVINEIFSKFCIGK